MGGLFDGKIHIPLGDYGANEEKIKHVVFHEYTHAVVYRLSPACPLWLNEGLAQLRGQEGRFLSPSQLTSTFRGLDARRAMLAYDMSLSLANRLKYHHGYLGIIAYLKELDSGGDEKALFKKHFFVTYEQFFADWKREKFS